MHSGKILKFSAVKSSFFMDRRVRVGKEALLLRLALVWNTEIARRYPKIIKQGELSATLSPADWSGLAVIESAFDAFREHSIGPKEHELGVARFLKFMVNQWKGVGFGAEQYRRLGSASAASAF
jgi:hypothetical protein